MKKALKKLISICLCLGSFTCLNNVKAETLSTNGGAGYSNWQDSCPSGFSCQSKTFYRYRDVSSWGGWDYTSQPGSFYKSAIQYKVKYSQTSTSYVTRDLGGWNSAYSKSFSGLYVTKVRISNHCHSARGNITTSFCTINNNDHGGGERSCSTSAKWATSITIYNSGGSPGYYSYDTSVWRCNGTADKAYYQFANVYVDGYVETKSDGYTNWQWNTSAPSGTTYVSHTTRTVYAAPSSWGSWSSWQESSVGKTTSRDVQTKTFYSYPLTYTVSYNANGGSGTMENSTATYNQPFRTRQNSFSKTGYVFNGWNEKADGSGTAWGLTSSGVYEAGKDWTWSYKNNITLYAQWKIATYSNSIAHWTWGYKNNEGNNGSKDAFSIGSTSFNALYNSTYTMDSSKQTTIPNGFKLRSSFGTSSIDGSWKAYNIGTSVTQQAKDMSYEYDYDPITYKITYNLNGGTNNSNNPSTYNVLYGVSLKSPTRKGYTFVGWYINGNKVTGINEGANASFSSANDLYTKLASRTTGNLTVEAKWTTNYIRYTADCLADSNGKIITQENAANSGASYKTVRKTFDVKETDTNVKNLCVGKYISKQKVSY